MSRRPDLGLKQMAPLPMAPESAAPSTPRDDAVRQQAFIQGKAPVVRVRLAEHPTGDLILDPALQARTETDPDTIEKYQKKFSGQLEDGADPALACPPLVAFHLIPPGQDPATYTGPLLPAHLVAGFHRHPAALGAGIQELRCEIRLGTWHEAYEFAVEHNRDNALPLSETSIEAITLRFLRDPHWRDASDNWIADKVGKSRKYVKRRRALVQAGAPLPDQHGPGPCSPEPTAAPSSATPQHGPGPCSSALAPEPEQAAGPAPQPETRRGRDGKRRKMPPKRTLPATPDPTPRRVGKGAKSPETLDVEERLRKKLGTRVLIEVEDPAKWRGSFRIDFCGKNHLDGLIQRFECMGAPTALEREEAAEHERHERLAQYDQADPAEAGLGLLDHLVQNGAARSGR